MILIEHIWRNKKKKPSGKKDKCDIKFKLIVMLQEDGAVCQLSFTLKKKNGQHDSMPTAILKWSVQIVLGKHTSNKS